MYAKICRKKLLRLYREKKISAIIADIATVTGQGKLYRPLKATKMTLKRKGLAAVVKVEAQAVGKERRVRRVEM